MREGEQADARRSGARAKNGHSFWVSFEGLDVFFDPPQSLNLIQQAIVALGRLVSCAQKPWIDENKWGGGVVGEIGKKKFSAFLSENCLTLIYLD